MFRILLALPTIAVLTLIQGWRLMLSPDHGVLGRLIQPHGACRFTPSCSHYAEEAIKRHGLVKGSVLTLKRLSKCHPFHSGGEDPVP